MQKPDYLNLGKRIRGKRKAKGWSQEELAGKCGISISFMGHIERSTRKMSLETFVAMCEVLEVSADELLWGTKRTCGSNVQKLLNDADGLAENKAGMFMKIMDRVAEVMNHY